MDTLTLCGTPMIDRDIGLVWNNYNRWRWVNGDGVSGDGLEKLEMGAVVQGWWWWRGSGAMEAMEWHSGNNDDDGIADTILEVAVADVQHGKYCDRGVIAKMDTDKVAKVW